MYRGSNALGIGIDTIGEDITVSTANGFTQDYETDEPVPIIVDKVIRCQVTDLSKADRELLGTSYDTNKMITLKFKLGTTVSQDDFFTYNGLPYTIVKNPASIVASKAFAKYDERTI